MLPRMKFVLSIILLFEQIIGQMLQVQIDSQMQGVSGLRRFLAQFTQHPPPRIYRHVLAAVLTFQLCFIERFQPVFANEIASIVV